jgi:hypothetical protein
LSRTSWILNTDVAERETGQLGEVAIVLRVEPCLDDIDQFDRATFFGSRLEEFLLARVIFFLVLQLAAFQLPTTGRFWVLTEGTVRRRFSPRKFRTLSESQERE